MKRTASAVLLAHIVLCGCQGAFVPIKKAETMDPAIAEAAGRIVVLRGGIDQNLTGLGEVVGYSCKNKLWDADATAEAATEQLRLAAAQRGATAISAPTCHGEAVSFEKNCWQSFTCKAFAYGDMPHRPSAGEVARSAVNGAAAPSAEATDQGMPETGPPHSSRAGNLYVPSPDHPADAATVAEVVDTVTRSGLVAPDDSQLVHACLDAVQAESGASSEPQYSTPSKTSDLTSYIGKLPSTESGTGNAKSPAERCIQGLLASLDMRLPQSPTGQPRLPAARSGDATVGLRLTGTIAGGPDAFEVTEFDPRSSARMGGIRLHDRLVAIDGVSIDGWDLERVEQALRGPNGSGVTVRVRRGGHSGPLEFPLVRTRFIPVEPTAMLLDGGRVLYLRIPSMYGEDPASLLDAVEATVGGLPDPAGIVVDLRANGGGLLRTAVGVAAVFLPDGSTIVESRGRTVGSSKTYLARPQDIGYRDNASFPKKFAGRRAFLRSARMALLIDSETASGSLAVVEALRWHRHATVIGEHSNPVANVRTVFPLKAGGRLILTTAQLFGPDGQCLDGRGSAPDLLVAQQSQAPEIGTNPDPVVQKALDLLNSAH